jgi:putative tryptophan/tyrosine transport system substrate-binding protein
MLEGTTVPRRTLGLLITLAMGLFVAPLAAATPGPGKVARIGILWPLAEHPYLEAFRQGLRDLGYVEGQHLTLEYRYAQGREEVLPALAADLVRLPVDVILTWGTPPARAAQHATSSIPIVVGAIGDPVRAGVVASLARPGGNVTGLTSNAVELEEKRLELLKALVPQASQVAVLWNPANPFSALALEQAQGVAPAVGITLHPHGVQAAVDLEAAFTRMSRERPDALLVHGDFGLLTHRTPILAFVAQSRLPAMYGWRDYVEAGGLMAYAPNYPDMFQRAALYVDKILKGAKPADLPVEQPKRYEFVINLKAAHAIDLTIPPLLLFQANEVIR